MKTAGIKQLVQEVLSTLPKPHTEDIIDDVFEAIENQPEWRRRYDELSGELGRRVANTWGGYWIAHSERRWGVDQVPAKKCTLLDSYLKLDTKGQKPGKKIKEAEALKVMSDHYQKNKTSLPRSIVSQREFIVDLLMEGFTVEEAFSTAG